MTRKNKAKLAIECQIKIKVPSAVKVKKRFTTGLSEAQVKLELIHEMNSLEHVNC